MLAICQGDASQRENSVKERQRKKEGENMNS